MSICTRGIVLNPNRINNDAKPRLLNLTLVHRENMTCLRRHHTIMTKSSKLSFVILRRYSEHTVYYAAVTSTLATSDFHSLNTIPSPTKEPTLSSGFREIHGVFAPLRHPFCVSRYRTLRKATRKKTSTIGKISSATPPEHNSTSFNHPRTRYISFWAAVTSILTNRTVQRIVQSTDRTRGIATGGKTAY